MWSESHSDVREETPPQSSGLENLREQFEQQQTVISQLKEIAISNEQQLTDKGKEIEEYAAKLSVIKSRSKASKRVSKHGESRKTPRKEEEEEGRHCEEMEETMEGEVSLLEEQHVSDRTEKIEKKSKNIDKMRQGNLVLLRKKLEENRMKFEQREKEMTENKKGVTEIMEHMRAQLEERNNTIQKLQKDLETRSSLPLGIHESSFEKMQSGVMDEGMNQREMYAQLVYKDNKILELNNRIMELEVHVLDLQENLKEKDAVIDARTRAITLMSEDMSRKSKSTLDSLDDTREQMKLMQNNFVMLEDRMKDEKEQLNKQLEEKDRKLAQIEESYKKLESVRFELTTRIAELQEKVVYLQTHNSELQRSMDDNRKLKPEREDSRIEDLRHALEESNKQLIRMKAQHKNKVKNLTKELNSLKEVSNATEEILRLQQRVAELEEDKGNLQLHLVDFDELKAAEERWKHQVQELEERVRLQNEDLSSHVHAISLLEKEKLNFIGEVQNERSRTQQLEIEVERMKNNITEIENLKVAAEMKAVVLEEQIDIISQEKANVQEENSLISQDRIELKQLLDTLRQEKTELQEEVMNLQIQMRENAPGDTDSNRSEFQMVSSNNSDEEKWKRLSESEEALSEEKHVKDSSNIELSLKLLESELEDAKKIIAEQKDVISNLEIKVEAKDEEIDLQQEVISKLDQLGNEIDPNKISEILKELNEMTTDLEEWKKRCNEVENRLKSLENEKVILESKLMEVTDENSLLNSHLKIQKDVTEDMSSKLKELNSIIADKDETIDRLENSLRHYEPNCDILLPVQPVGISVLDDSTAVELDSTVGAEDYEQLNVSRVTPEVCSQTSLETKDKIYASEDLYEELARKDAIIAKLECECQNYKDHIQVLSHDIETHGSQSQLLQEKTQKIEKFTKKLEEIAQLVSEKEEDLKKSNERIQILTGENMELTVILQSKVDHVQSIEEKEKEMQKTLHTKDETIQIINRKLGELTQQCNTVNAELEEKTNNLKLVEQSLDSALSDLKTTVDINQGLKNENSLLIQQIDSLRKDIVLANEESELLVRTMKGEVQVLKEQLVDSENNIHLLGSEVEKKMEDIRILVDQENSLRNDYLKIQEELNKNEAISKARNQELVNEILKKDNDLVELSSQVEELKKYIENKNSEVEVISNKLKEIENVHKEKETKELGYEEKLCDMQNLLGALQGKLQEREGFIESLEQELAKSHSREQHLEEGLCNFEERRRSLETKFVVLDEQLQQSYRCKEEAEEHEGILEYRLKSLVSSEENLRKKLEDLTSGNADLSHKITELNTENEVMKRNLSHADNSLRTAHKEIERLSALEVAYNESLETIEQLQVDLKRYSVEFERSMKENSKQAQLYAESLETDMKNLNNQIEVLDTEKRALMEHCEKLNDIKINLEEELNIKKEEIESRQEKCSFNENRILLLEKTLSQKEVDYRNIMSEKEKEIQELNICLSEMKTENEISSAKNEEGNRILHHEEKNVMAADQLKSEIEHLRTLLDAKESEIQSYQSRLLQLQFAGTMASHSEGDHGKLEHHEKHQADKLEDINSQLQATLNEKDCQLTELGSLLENTNHQMCELKVQLSNSCRQIEVLSSETLYLQQEIRDRDSKLNEQVEKLTKFSNSDSISQQLDRIHKDYQSQLSALKSQNESMYKELLEEKARHEISVIIQTAKEQIKEKELPTDVEYDSTVKEASNEDLQITIKKLNARIADMSMEIEHLKREEKLHISSSMPKENVSHSLLIEESNALKEERGVLLSKLNEISVEVSTMEELPKQLHILKEELEMVKNEKEVVETKLESLQLQLSHLETGKNISEYFKSSLQSRDNVDDGTGIVSDYFNKISSDDFQRVGDTIVGMTTTSDITAEERISVMDTGDSLKKDDKNEECHSEVKNVIEASLGSEIGYSWEEGEGEGWSWGADEVHLEEEHLQRQQAVHSPPSEQRKEDLNIHLKVKIETLEKENLRLSRELKAAQVRSGKVLKKMKELKLKNDNLILENQKLSSKKTDDFSSLDLAIEEELKIRIDTLEKELRDSSMDRDSLKVEKEALQRRVGVLLTANERLTEREKQNDIEYWQNKNKELSNEIEALQWKIGELTEEKSSNDNSEMKFSNWDTAETVEISQIQELQEQITALATDNEHLQSMLEEQRNLRVAAEAALKDLQQYTSSKEAMFLQQEGYLKDENMSLKENNEILYKEVEQLRLQTGNDSLLAENATLRDNYDVLYRELLQLRSNANSDVIAEEYSSMRENYEAMYREMENLQSQMVINNTKQANYESLQEAHEKLLSDTDNVQKEYCELSSKYETLQNEMTSHMRTCSTKITEQQNQDVIEASMQAGSKYIDERHKQFGECSFFHVQYEEKIGMKDDSMFPKVGQDTNNKLQKDTGSQTDLESKSISYDLSSSNIKQTAVPVPFFEKETSTDLIEMATSAAQTQTHVSAGDLAVKLEENEKLIASLKNDIIQKIEELNVLREMFSNEQQEWALIEQDLNQQIMVLQEELKAIQETAQTERGIRESLVQKKQELSDLKAQLSFAEERLSSAHCKIQDLELLLSEKEEDVQNTSRKAESQEHFIQQIVSAKEEELKTLREKLAAADQEKNEAVSIKEQDINNLKYQISDREKEIEHLTFMKNEDIQNLKIQLQELEKEMEERIKLKDKEIQDLQSQLTENNSRIQELLILLEEEEEVLRKLRADLEAREDEITEAVIQIRDKNVEIKQLRELSEAKGFVTDGNKREDASGEDTATGNQQIQQNELDLALYMLHQRDVRCEELTLELMQLLEERDTLQLRLSTALRINEDLRNKINKTSLNSFAAQVHSSQSYESDSSSSTEQTQAIAPIDSELPTEKTLAEPKEDLEVLANKLSQLHSVDYRRDVTLQDEREQRHSDQIMLLQQRTSGVLVESNYTLSRDVQSPSTVLLNWLWGRSTPKVMHL